MKPYKIKCDHCNALAINGYATHETGCNGRLVFIYRGKEFHQWHVYALDVWGNARDGFEVNDRSQIGSIMVPADASDTDIIRALKQADMLNKRCRFSSFRVNGDDHMLTIDSAKTSEPIYQLETA